MAYNNEAKRLFERLNLKLPKLIKDYRGCSILWWHQPNAWPYARQWRQKAISSGFELQWCWFSQGRQVRESSLHNPIEYFAKDGVVNEKFVLGLVKGVFKKYNGWSGKYLVATASSRYELLTKVIMVLGRD